MMDRKKLDMILENKVVQKLKLENNVFTKNALLTCYPEMEKKIFIDFDFQNRRSILNLGTF